MKKKTKNLWITYFLLCYFSKTTPDAFKSDIKQFLNNYYKN